jgi:hypothetical protein
VLNAIWQVFALAVVVLALGIVFWDVFLRGHRTRRALALAAVGGAIIFGGGIVQDVRGDGWGWLVALPGAGAAALARRVDRPDGAGGRADGPPSGASSS